MMCSNPKPLSNPQFDSNLPGYNMSSRIDKSSWLQYPGWWFQASFIFHFIYGIIPTPLTNSIIFQDGCCTINQYLFLVTIDKSDIVRIWFLSSYFPGTEQSTTNGSSVFIFIPVGSPRITDTWAQVDEVEGYIESRHLERSKQNGGLGFDDKKPSEMWIEPSTYP